MSRGMSERELVYRVSLRADPKNQTAHDKVQDQFEQFQRKQEQEHQRSSKRRDDRESGVWKNFSSMLKTAATEQQKFHDFGANSHTRYTDKLVAENNRGWKSLAKALELAARQQQGYYKDAERLSNRAEIVIDRASQKMEKAFMKATGGAMQLVRGVALLGLVGEKDLQKLQNVLLKVQGGIDILKGLLDVIEGISRGYKAYAAAASAAAAAQTALNIANASAAAGAARNVTSRLAGGAVQNWVGGAMGSMGAKIGAGVASSGAGAAVGGAGGAASAGLLAKLGGPLLAGAPYAAAAIGGGLGANALFEAITGRTITGKSTAEGHGQNAAIGNRYFRTADWIGGKLGNTGSNLAFGGAAQLARWYFRTDDLGDISGDRRAAKMQNEADRRLALIGEQQTIAATQLAGKRQTSAADLAARLGGMGMTTASENQADQLGATRAQKGVVQEELAKAQLDFERANKGDAGIVQRGDAIERTKAAQEQILALTQQEAAQVREMHQVRLDGIRATIAGLEQQKSVQDQIIATIREENMGAAERFANLDPSKRQQITDIAAKAGRGEELTLLEANTIAPFRELGDIAKILGTTFTRIADEGGQFSKLLESSGQNRQLADAQTKREGFVMEIGEKEELLNTARAEAKAAGQAINETLGTILKEFAETIKWEVQNNRDLEGFKRRHAEAAERQSETG